MGFWQRQAGIPWATSGPCMGPCTKSSELRRPLLFHRPNHSGSLMLTVWSLLRHPFPSLKLPGVILSISLVSSFLLRLQNALTLLPCGSLIIFHACPRTSPCHLSALGLKLISSLPLSPQVSLAETDGPTRNISMCVGTFSTRIGEKTKREELRHVEKDITSLRITLQLSAGRQFRACNPS